MDYAMRGPDQAAALRQAELDAHTRRRYVERTRGQLVAQMDGRSVRAGIVSGTYPFAPEPDRFGSEPPAGAVLRWEGPSGATLVATNHPDAGADSWEITGDDVGYSWAEVADRIGNRPCAVAIGWRDIPTREPAPRGDDAVRDWAASFLEPQVSAPAEPLPDDGVDLEGSDSTANGAFGRVEYHADGRHRHLNLQGKVMYRGESHRHYVRDADRGRVILEHSHEDGNGTYGWSIPGSE